MGQHMKIKCTDTVPEAKETKKKRTNSINNKNSEFTVSYFLSYLKFEILNICTIVNPYTVTEVC